MKVRKLDFIWCLCFPFAFATNVYAAAFLETDGKVVIDAESADEAGDWLQENEVNGALSGAYLVWTGANHFNVNNAGRDTFRVQEAGNYEIQWRSYIAEGNDRSEANDSRVRFPTGQHIDRQHALDGWTKSFLNRLNEWSWSSQTVDSVLVIPFVSFRGR